jgi:hypothetical protein
MKKLSLIIIVALSSCVEPAEYGCIDEKDKFYEINDCEGYSTYSCRSTGTYANEETGYYRFTLEYNMQVVNFVSYPGDSKCLVSYGPVLRVKEMED